MQNPEFGARYRCINGCSRDYALTEVLYRCPDCGDLLEVQHDLDALRARTARQWRELFDLRFPTAHLPDGSGVWSKKEWVAPEIDNRNIVSFYEGRSPLVELKTFVHRSRVGRLWVKLCGTSHTGSFKDLGMTVLVSMVKQMVANGQPIRAVACASTGDTSAALAAYCAQAAIPALVLLPKEKVSTAQLIQPLAHGALTFSLDTDFDGCMQIIQQLTEAGGIYLANSMNSLRIEGQKTVSLELVQQLNWRVPDWVIVPGGNLGNVTALGKGFLEMKAVGLVDRLPRLVCAQTERANPLFESYQQGFHDFRPKKARTTLASAIQIGNPVSVRKAIRVLKKLDGIVAQATEEELAEAAALADRAGLFVCPQTAVALATLLQLIEGGDIRSDAEVVVISTAHGLKFVDFKLRYHEARLPGIAVRHANLPIELPADPDLIEARMKELL